MKSFQNVIEYIRDDELPSEQQGLLLRLPLEELKGLSIAGEQLLRDTQIVMAELADKYPISSGPHLESRG